MRKLLLVLTVFSALAFAQDKTPQLTATEKIALEQIARDSQAAQQAAKKAQDEFAAFQQDFAKEHPGYHFDPNSGIVKDEQKPKK